MQHEPSMTWKNVMQKCALRGKKGTIIREKQKTGQKWRSKPKKVQHEKLQHEKSATRKKVQHEKRAPQKKFMLKTLWYEKNKSWK